MPSLLLLPCRSAHLIEAPQRPQILHKPSTSSRKRKRGQEEQKAGYLFSRTREHPPSKQPQISPPSCTAAEEEGKGERYQRKERRPPRILDPHLQSLLSARQPVRAVFYISQMSYSSGSDDERSLTDSEVLKNALIKCISEVHSAGSFATFGTVDNFVHPGISVDSVGTVRLPLLEDDAHALVQTSRQAPFGKGTATFVDVSVRKTWEIDAAKVQFLNKGWQCCLDRIVEKVTRELGVDGGSRNVHAEFYKMLLYEEGAMFKAHKEYVISRLYKVLGWW